MTGERSPVPEAPAADQAGPRLACRGGEVETGWGPLGCPVHGLPDGWCGDQGDGAWGQLRGGNNQVPSSQTRHQWEEREVSWAFPGTQRVQVPWEALTREDP